MYLARCVTTLSQPREKMHAACSPQGSTIFLAKEADSFLVSERVRNESLLPTMMSIHHTERYHTSKLKQSKQDIIKNISTSATSQAYRLIISVIYPRFYIYHEVYHRRIIVNVRRPLICSWCKFATYNIQNLCICMYIYVYVYRCIYMYMYIMYIYYMIYATYNMCF